MNRMRSCSITLLLALCLVHIGHAQTVVITTATLNAPPTNSTARAYAFSASGALQSMGTTDVAVTENGAPVTSTIACDPASGGRNISLMIAADVSASSRLGTPSVVELERSAAVAANGALGSAADEIGLVEFDQRAFMLWGLTSGRTGFDAAAAQIASGRGSSFGNGLTSDPMGALSQLFAARHARTLILMVDGNASIDAASLLATARVFRLTCYVMGIGTALGDDLRALADSTGGAWAESITTTADAQAYARAYVTDAKRLPGCTVSWQSAVGCTGTRTLEFKRAATTRTIVAKAPASLQGTLEVSSTSLAFGEVAPGQSKDITVVLTARNRPVTISKVTSNNSAFGVINGAAPPTITLQPDESHTVRVRYQAADSVAKIATVVVENDACGPIAIYCKGGFRAKDNLLKLLSPNGGERFVAGSDTSITWTGVLPEDYVRIDVSNDNGSSWRSVTEAASGLKYTWAPQATGTSMLVRIQQTLIDQTKILLLEDHSAPVYSAEFIQGGAKVATGSHDRTIKIWDATTGALEQTLFGHRDWVWSLAAQPNGSILASGSFDGDVRLWNVQDGSVINTITVGARIWSVAFRSDGKKLAVGFEGGISIIDVETGAIDATTNVPGEAVYSITYTPFDAKLLTAEGRTAAIRDPATLSSVDQRFRGHDGVVYSAAVSPDGSTIATASADRTVRTWNATTGVLLKQSEQGLGSYLDIEFNATGAQILAASGDGTAKFFETSTLNRLNSLPGHNGLVYSARFDTDKRRVVTASTDLTARVWDIAGLRLAQDVSDAAFAVVAGTVSSDVIAIGDAVVGTGIDKSLTIVRNTGSEPVVIRSMRLRAGSVQDFDITPLVKPQIIAPGGSLVSEVRFAPTAAGDRTAVLDVDVGTSVLSVTMRGRGLQPAVNAPALIEFGRRVANRDVIDTTIAVTIPAGGAAVSVVGTAVTGPAAAPFSITSTTGAYALNPGGTHPLRLQFKSTDLGRFAARVTIDVESGEDVVLFLYGEGAGDASIQTSSALVFETSPCSTATSERELTFKNTGNSTLTVFDVAFEGADGDEFAVVAPTLTFPFTMPPNDTRTLRLRHTPSGTGTKAAQIVIVSNALNAASGKSSVQLVARQDSVGYELSRPTLTFNGVNDGDVATERLLLVNNGTVALRWPRTQIQINDKFTIVSIKPDITPPGSSSEITVRFAGGVAGQSYTGSYTFRDSVCGRDVPLNIVANVKSFIGVTVSAPSQRVRTSSVIDVPVFITEKVNLDRTTVRTFTADVIVNATILYPSGNTPAGTLDATQTLRTIPVTLTIPAGSDSLAGTLQFKTLWGNDTASSIRFTNIVVADTMRIKARDGEVILDDLCRKGGPRLFRNTGAGAGIVVSPQPTTGPTTADLTIVERGQTSVQLTDVTGRVVSVMVDRFLVPGTYHVPFTTDTLPAGTYFLVMTTPTDRITRRVDVAK